MKRTRKIFVVNFVLNFYNIKTITNHFYDMFFRLI